jgi:hypothetical protein
MENWRSLAQAVQTETDPEKMSLHVEALCKALDQSWIDHGYVSRSPPVAAAPMLTSTQGP